MNPNQVPGHLDLSSKHSVYYISKVKYLTNYINSFVYSAHGMTSQVDPILKTIDHLNYKCL